MKLDHTRDVLVFSDDLGKIKSNSIRIFAILIFISFMFLISPQKSNLLGEIIFTFVIAILFFVTGLAIYRTYFNRRSVVISPDGIEDSGITIETVPWSAVDSVELKTVPRALTGQQPVAVLLRLRPRAGDTLKLTRRGKMLFLNNDALWIPVGGGMIVDGNSSSPESFSRTIAAYARTYGKELK
ncbi:hypothetical protein FJ546_06475 [Mesorhizobium sp. B2-4-19]|uniref:hypothetical protein n=1 Tax=Mesorhizobium sp. B2-4-19 TaxID=2589930 RepID=UPI00112B881A|nr:hypothetical protein [Mesorhizobium sp. B2-4-19]TPK66412.1 hypothetical protein FJ546_06475 [Mesorhizobium sp. B2-4-19]